MANLIALQTLLDGPRNLVVKLSITGDASGDEAATMFIDVSTYAGAPTKVKIITATSNLFTFDLVLLWDATTDLLALPIPTGASITDFKPIGGLPNNAGAGVTGDIRFTTVGLGANDYGTVVLEMVKDYD